MNSIFRSEKEMGKRHFAPGDTAIAVIFNVPIRFKFIKSLSGSCLTIATQWWIDGVLSSLSQQEEDDMVEKYERDQKSRREKLYALGFNDRECADQRRTRKIKARNFA